MVTLLYHTKEKSDRLLPKQLARSRTFWDRYEWRLQDDFSYERFEEQPIRMRLTPQASLVLDPGDDFLYISLCFQERGKEEIEIAWDDEAHFHPYVLRVDEWQAIAAHTARMHKTDMWIPGLLLRRFVGVDSAEALAAVTALELDMRRDSELYTAEELEAWPIPEPYRDPAFWDTCGRKWMRRDPWGWIFVGEDAYSLRRPENPDFPFEAWNRMIRETQKTED